jgi:hypothetical protein
MSRLGSISPSHGLSLALLSRIALSANGVDRCMSTPSALTSSSRTVDPSGAHGALVAMALAASGNWTISTAGYEFLLLYVSPSFSFLGAAPIPHRFRCPWRAAEKRLDRESRGIGLAA